MPKYNRQYVDNKTGQLELSLVLELKKHYLLSTKGTTDLVDMQPAKVTSLQQAWKWALG